MRHSSALNRGCLAFAGVFATSVAILAQSVATPDWGVLRQQYSVVGQMFSALESWGYAFDVRSASTRSFANLFLLTAIPVVPPKGVRSDATYLSTPQPTAGLVTSIIDRPSVVPTEAVIVYAKTDAPDSVLFRGELVESRKTVLEGFFNPKDLSITMKRNELMLSKAIERLQERSNCFDQLYKGEAEKCSGPTQPVCAVVAWLYAHDQCRRVMK